MPDEAVPEEPVEALVVDGALRSRDDEAAWSIAWGRLPPDVKSIQAVFRAGRRSQPAARVGVVGRHWAAEVAGVSTRSGWWPAARHMRPSRSVLVRSPRRAQADDLPALHTLVDGFRRDQAAITAGLSHLRLWSR